MIPLVRAVQKPLPWYIYVFFAFLILTFTLLWINPVTSKAYLYGVFRELAKTEMTIKTWNWATVESDHFIVKYTSADKNIAKMVLQNSETNYKLVAKNMNYYPKQKIQVVIYPTRETLSRSFGWDANESAMGVYWAGVIRILSPNAWIESSNPNKMATVFQSKGPMAHEFTHLIVDYLTKGNYPRWFTEGVAQYNEYNITGFKLPNDEPDLSLQLYALKDMDSNYDNLPDQGLAYRESLVAIKYIVQNYGRDKVSALMTELGNGYTMDQAMQKVLGVNLNQFESDWHDWLKDNMAEMS